MWASLVLIFPFFVASMATKGVYQSCYDDNIKDNNDYKYHILCKTSTFQVERPGDSTYRGMKEMMDCTFTKVGWMDKSGTTLNVTKIAEDLDKGGYPGKKEQLEKLNESCKNVYDPPKNAMNFLDCIALRPNTTKEIIPFIRKREPEFFNKFHCKGITL